MKLNRETLFSPHKKVRCLTLFGWLATAFLFSFKAFANATLLCLHLHAFNCLNQHSHPLCLGLHSLESVWRTGLWCPWTRSSLQSPRNWAHELEPYVRMWWGPPGRWVAAGWGTSAGTPWGLGGPLLPNTCPPHTGISKGSRDHAIKRLERNWWKTMSPLSSLVWRCM